jgi:hypothetical protein
MASLCWTQSTRNSSTDIVTTTRSWIGNGKSEGIEGKTLLEIGCGRGCGLNYLDEKLKPKNMRLV